jgi:hypothetical protein
MKTIAVALLIYGLSFLFAPAWRLESMFHFYKLPLSIWPRIIGGLFLLIAAARYLCDRHYRSRSI